jgi:cobalt-zinc-cadmium efflux system outer membrane protein
MRLKLVIILAVLFIFLKPSARAEEPTESVTLKQAQALALMHNPALRAFLWEIRAQEAATLQTGLLPNPTIGADLQDIGVSAFSESVPQPQAALTLSQIIELGGKRTKRREASALSRDLASLDYEAKRIEIFTQVSHAFTDLLKAQQQLSLMEENFLIAEETARVVAERVKAGKGSPIEEIRANIVLASVGIQRDRAEKEMEAARFRLASTWGRGATPASILPQFDRADGTLSAISPIPSLAQLTEGLSKNPELIRWTTELAQRQAETDLAQSQAVPDLTLMGGLRNYKSTGDNVFIVGLSLPLPIFNKNQGGIQEAHNRLSKGEEEQMAAQVRVSAALSDAYSNLLTAHIEVTVLQDMVLPGATQAFEAINEGYRLGKFGLLDVLDAQRTLFSSREQNLRALADYHHAAADIKGLIGEPLQGQN